MVQIRKVNFLNAQNTYHRTLTHDGIIHYPSGGGSYVFKSNFVGYLNEQLHKDSLRISIGAQPNSSPHFGTLIVFCLAFSIGQQFKLMYKKATEVFFEIIDTAPYKTIEIDGIEYQISLRDSKAVDQFLPDYLDLLNTLKSFSGVSYDLRRQKEFNSEKNLQTILHKIISKRDKIAPILDPDKKLLKIRISCPDCGLTDKKSVNTHYYNDIIESYCPTHGFFETSIEKDASRLEYNTPLRNLIRALLYAEDNSNEINHFEWLRVTGSDYAGFYQEQLLYNCASILGCPAHSLPKIVYAPLIVDWSGAKLSKTLYVQQNAYQYLPSYLVNFSHFREELGKTGMKQLFDETGSWLKEPHKLFRSYSVYYFMELFSHDK